MEELVNKMKPYFIIAIIIILCMVGNAQEITNIHFEQEGKMINIYYDLIGGGTYDVKVFCSKDGGKTWGNPLTQITGAIGKDMKAGYGKKIVWDVLAEREKLQGDIKFKVEAMSENHTGTFTDNRDGKTYKWVKIGNQVWMAENLNYSTISGSWCYDKNSTKCTIYGRLYDWLSAKTSCPVGWHLPSDVEWTNLTNFLGGETISGGKMKETETSHWSSPNTGATNSSGFTALPGGLMSSGGGFYVLADGACFWSATENSTTNAWTRGLDYSNANLYRGYNYKTYGFSLRCCKD
jgi:uncharacterized protein (TIGR02145 family)